jgi:hypothetical protein
MVLQAESNDTFLQVTEVWFVSINKILRYINHNVYIDKCSLNILKDQFGQQMQEMILFEFMTFNSEDWFEYIICVVVVVSVFSHTLLLDLYYEYFFFKSWMV